MKIKIEDLILWLLIAAIIAVALWLFHGSPTEESAIISLALFVAASELLIWKKIYGFEKNIAISFIKIKNEVEDKHRELKTLIKK